MQSCAKPLIFFLYNPVGTRLIRNGVKTLLFLYNSADKGLTTEGVNIFFFDTIQQQSVNLKYCKLVIVRNKYR